MQNETMIQLYHWYSEGDGSYWNFVKDEAPRLAAAGITAAWLPPAFKCTSGADSVGYDVYDIYDLGEFDQKGTIRTRYGTLAEYSAAVKALQENGIKAIADIVLNHMGGGDETELVTACMVDEENRNALVGEPTEIEAYTKFTFPGRNKKYSEFNWDYQCFSGVDYDHKTGTSAIYKIMQQWGEGWAEMVDGEKGNYDYLMFNDVEFRNPAVKEELKRWGKWYQETIGFDGVRLDAVKHISPGFYNEWLDHLRHETGTEIFAVGEYWAPGDLDVLMRYIEATDGRMHLFDSALQHNLHEASKAGNDFPLNEVMNGALVSAMPGKAVTVVDNHDTQPLQALEAPVEHWFKPLAYALILLREGGYPCVFFPDLYGAVYTDKGSDGNDHEIHLAIVAELPALLGARRQYAYGVQQDYLDHSNCIGWTRSGDDEHDGCAVLLSNGDDGSKHMNMGERYAHRTFADLLQKHPRQVILDENGGGEFLVSAGSVSVWIPA